MDLRIQYLFIGTAISIITAIIVNGVNFNRTKKWEQKNKIRFIVDLIEKSGLHIKREIEHIESYISALTQSTVDAPKRVLITYNPLKLLAEQIIKEDYYLAYLHRFKNVVAQKQLFNDILKSSVHINEILSLIHESHSTIILANHKRREEFVNLHNETETFLVLNILKDPNSQHYNVINNFYSTYRAQQRHNIDVVDSIKTYFVDPLVQIDIQTRNLPNTFSKQIHDMGVLYNNIKFQNSALKRHFEDDIKMLKPELINFNSLIKELNNSQVKQFYK